MFSPFAVTSSSSMPILRGTRRVFFMIALITGYFRYESNSPVNFVLRNSLFESRQPPRKSLGTPSTLGSVTALGDVSRVLVFWKLTRGEVLTMPQAQPELKKVRAVL